MKSSRNQIHSRVHKVPTLQFQDQKLTSFSGAVIFQVLFSQLNLKARLKKCFGHLIAWPIYGHHVIVLLLVVHLLLGYRRLRDLDYYRDDPLILRLMGLRKAPDVGTVSRALTQMDSQSVENTRSLCRSLVLEGMKRSPLPRYTLDFDGSVQSTTGHQEGTAIGFNRKKKGARSYYSLFCTVAQTGQFLDRHHRPGNVHDSNGASGFMQDCVAHVRRELPQAHLESRMDSAFFNETILGGLDQEGVEFTASVPFERFPELKGMIERQRRWKKIDGDCSYFEIDWTPQSWEPGFRFLCIRQRIRKRIQGPLQLELFTPLDFHYEYKVIVTNKRESAKAVLLFHHGRGSQEGLFAEAKQHAGLDIIPCRRLEGNQMFTLCSMMAHNLSREIQMRSAHPIVRARPKRPAAWTFQTLDTLRRRIIQRAGRLIRPEGELTLVMSANSAVSQKILHFLDCLQKEAA